MARIKGLSAANSREFCSEFNKIQPNGRHGGTRILPSWHKITDIYYQLKNKNNSSAYTVGDWWPWTFPTHRICFAAFIRNQKLYNVLYKERHIWALQQQQQKKTATTTDLPAEGAERRTLSRQNYKSAFSTCYCEMTVDFGLFGQKKTGCAHVSGHMAVGLVSCLVSSRH